MAKENKPVTCGYCQFEAKNNSGLAIHLRTKHGNETGENYDAALETIAKLKEMDRIREVDEARRVAILSMARCLDVNPYDSSMWRVYNQALQDIREEGYTSEYNFDEALEKAAEKDAESAYWRMDDED